MSFGCVSHDRIEDIQDEILEKIFTQSEQGKYSISDVMGMINSPIKSDALTCLEKQQLILLDSDNVKFTKTGEDKAINLIRRHRLAESLFATIFELSDDEVNDQACRIEHENILSEHVTDSICTLLGHPPVCPHGKSIPKGKCCNLLSYEIQPIVKSLKFAEIGRYYKIIFITPTSNQCLIGLGNFGLIPGSIVKVIRKGDSFVLKVNQTEIAMENEIAYGIYGRLI